MDAEGQKISEDLAHQVKRRVNEDFHDVEVIQ